MRVLVTYGSERGSTAEIADAIAEELLNARFDVVLADAHDVKRIDEFDAVIIGGAIYMGRWHRDARRFVKRHAGALRERIVYAFSSGPLDASADERDLPPPASVARLVHAAGARAHVTFGGKLARDAEGFIASRMATKLAGDWRSWHRIRAWAGEIAKGLREAPARPVRQAVADPSLWLLAGLCFFFGLAGLASGATLVARPFAVVFVVLGIASIVAGVFVSFEAQALRTRTT